MKEMNDFIASKLLKLKAIKLQPNNPFTWATGWLSPIYFDSRKILSYPQQRSLIKIEMAHLLMEKFPDVEVIAAVAPNAIAIGMMVAEELNLPFVYVHSHPKDHGFENMIEGDLRPRQKVVIIEDQISLGKNCVKVQEALQKDACEVLGLLTIFCYELQEGLKALEQANLPFYALTHFDAVIQKAEADNIITKAAAKKIYEWQQNPQAWTK